MSEADERDAIAIRSQEARRWLAIVEEDLDVARASIDLAHPRHGSAACLSGDDASPWMEIVVRRHARIVDLGIA
ncbi:MAG: hypothetical protein HQL40_07425 [Alphaproteobacteria bacterium]|nr:hypothetical protein [Alphaproteobacteria bacterium]